MKEVTKNRIVFILSALLVLVGFFTTDIFAGIKNTLTQFMTDLGVYGYSISFEKATDNLESAVADNVSYHDEAMDFNSLYMRYTGRRVIEKEDSTVILADGGYLANPRPYMSDSDIEVRAESVRELMAEAEKRDAKFIYVMAPTKGYSLNYPSHVEDYTASNCNRFASKLKEKGIPFLSLIKQAQKDGISEEEMFFATDHHWRPEKGIWASAKVGEFMKEAYGFKYDESVWDETNYNMTAYKSWFLGSQGKKVGRYFSPHGPDDINLITPSFDTSLTEEQPIKGLWREGTFEDLLYKENIEVKNHYNINPYATYSGGDFREQIITNRLNPHGKTVLVIRDSFGCAFTPFFSLGFNKTYVVDIREGGYVGEPLDLKKYMDEIKPDYVMVFYTGLSGGDSLYAFLNKS